jgi:choline dehydrogenase-like flavoprotein
MTGRGLHEQVGLTLEVMLDGKENFGGSSVSTGLNYALFDGEHRRSAGAAMVVFRNWWTFGLRLEFGRWRETLPLVIVVEDVPHDENFVGTSNDGSLPVASHRKMSDYARRGLGRAVAKLPELLRPLPVESIHVRAPRPTENHIQGTLRMGHDPATSVIDANLIHHQYRNLVVVGTAGFPSSSCANPALTAAALSLRSAERVM